MDEIKLNDIEMRARNILLELLGDFVVDFDENDNFLKIGINSISFIKLILLVENEFDIRFDREYFSLRAIDSLKKMCNEIYKRIYEMSGDSMK